MREIVDRRSVQHVIAGVAITVGAVALSTLLARLQSTEPERELYTDYDEPEPPQPKANLLLGILWPPLFMALTISGLRIWNAPRSPARTQALALFGVMQGLNAVWMALGPRRLGGQLAAGVASVGTALAYACRARRVAPASTPVLAAPYLGWMGLANALGDEIWRKRREATVH